MSDVILYPPQATKDPAPRDTVPNGWNQLFCADGVTKARRNSMPVMYTFDGSFTPMMRTAAKLGMDAWSKASNGKISFAQAKPPNVILPLRNTNPGIWFSSLNGWIAPDPKAIATTRPNDFPVDQLTLSMVTVNTGPYGFHAGGVYYVFADPKHPKIKPSADINLVLLHEIGHCLGFGHSGLSDSIMNPYIHVKTAPDGFSTDDLLGINTVYP